MIKLYYHGGSENHGCEAIVRSTFKVMEEHIVLCTKNSDRDKKYALEQSVSIEDDIEMPLNAVEKLIAAFDFKLNHQDYLYTEFSHKPFFDKVKKDDIYLSIGGDNYCYAGKDILGYYNRLLHKKGAKTVFWGCSFEPADMTDKIAKDIALYDLIAARESISYHLLKTINPNTILVCDPAFQLDSQPCTLPHNFVEGKTIGINVSPLIMNYESENGITLKNYIHLMQYILKNTECSIALIPHVVENGNDDRQALEELYRHMEDENRICMIDDCNCMQLKYFISKCRMFIGARTHSTIAAYSTCVPTLAVGYSVKARGIAKDLFGAEENYVIPVQSLQTETDLTDAFIWLEKNESSIRRHLNHIMPEYKATVYAAVNKVKELK